MKSETTGEGGAVVLGFVLSAEAIMAAAAETSATDAPAPRRSWDRDEAIAAIRQALQKRSGKSWSVKGGRGTAWGWIRIQTPPRRTVCWACADERAAECTCARYRGAMPKAERVELAQLLGMEYVHQQGVSIAASGDHRREYVDRAEGRTPSVIGTPYWD